LGIPSGEVQGADVGNVAGADKSDKLVVSLTTKLSTAITEIDRLRAENAKLRARLIKLGVTRTTIDKALKL
jgi:hypothetical protein